MRTDHVLILFSVICFVLAIYFAGLSFQKAEEPSRTQLVTVAASLLVLGVVILVLLLVTFVLKRTLSAGQPPRDH